MFDELREIDTAAIEELSRIKEEQELLEGRLARMEEERDQVSPAVYERVRQDYESRCRDLDAKASPLKEQAGAEYGKLRALGERLRQALEAARLEKEELEFRHRLGEYDEDAFQERIGAVDGQIGEREGELGEVEELQGRFVAAVRSEEDLQGTDKAGGETAEEPSPEEPSLEEAEVEVLEATGAATVEATIPFTDDGEDRTTSTSHVPEIPLPPPEDGDRPSDSEATMLLKGPRLVIHRGDGVEELRLGSEPITIGRAVKNAVRFLSTSVSRHHARIGLGAEGFMVSDLGSGNGTLVNGEPVAGERRLREGDMVQVGSEVMVFREN